jgi:hypothetical protein
VVRFIEYKMADNKFCVPMFFFFFKLISLGESYQPWKRGW